MSTLARQSVTRRHRRTLAIAAVLAAGLVAAAIPIFVDGWWLFVGSPSGPPSMLNRVAVSTSSVMSVVAGLIALGRRPGNPIGAWLTVSGLLGPVGFLVGNGSQLVILLSGAAFVVSATLGAAIPISFPTGRLDGRARSVLAVVAVTTVGYRLQEILFFDPTRSIPGWTQPNPFYVNPDPVLVDRLNLVMNPYGIVFLVLFGAWLARRWLSLTGPARRTIAPMLAGGLVFAVASTAQAAADTAGVSGDAWSAIQFVHTLSFSAIPAGFLAGLLRLRMARSAVVDLVAELGDTPRPAILRGPLSTALGDPSLDVYLWDDDAAAYTDDGRARISLDAVAAGRAVTLLERDGSPLAAILHDPALLEDPGLVASVATAVRLSVENARLQAAVEAQLAEVRASRVRIVEATDAERRRLERDIHDGAQQRLVALSLAIGRARQRLPAGADPELDTTLTQAADEARAALAELRELARGIHPAILAQAGLEPALRTLVDRSAVPTELRVTAPERLAPAVEATAYFTVAEALTNVAKHADASTACVDVAADGGWLSVEVRDDGCGGAEVAAGSGLRGLRDRVEAVGGRLDVSSPRGHGTAIKVALPLEAQP